MRPEPPADITLPITPMLDMSFQLLSFFILIFRPLPLEGQMAMHLPAVGDKTDLSDRDDEEVIEEYRLRVDATARGDVALLSLRGPTRNIPIASNQKLLKELQSLPKPLGRGTDGVSITIESSAGLTYARLIEIMDVCRKAGYKSIGLAPIPKDQG
jgi:biopolymer transport protein ExbD